jgi:hypothetical protein
LFHPDPPPCGRTGDTAVRKSVVIAHVGGTRCVNTMTSMVKTNTCFNIIDLMDLIDWIDWIDLIALIALIVLIACDPSLDTI